MAFLRGKIIFKFEELVQGKIYCITMNSIEKTYECTNISTNILMGNKQATFVDIADPSAFNLILDTQDIMNIMIYEAVLPEDVGSIGLQQTTQKMDCYTQNHEIVDVELYENGHLNKPYKIKYCRTCRKEVM